MTHRRCCCGSTQDPPCPNQAGFCVRASASGFTKDAACTGVAPFPGEGNVAVEIENLAIDGPLNIVSNVFHESTGLITYRGYHSGDEHLVGADRLISGSMRLTCRNNRPAVYEFYIGRSSSDPTPNLLSGAIFQFRVPESQARYIDVPQTLPNDFASIACSPGGLNNAICRTGTVEIQAFFDTSCDQNAPDMLLGGKCGDHSQTIIIDPSTATGEPRFLYNGEIYEIIGRTSGTPVSGTWTSDACPSMALQSQGARQPMKAQANAGTLNGPRKRGLVSESELNAMGADPDAEAKALKQGGCCDPPRE